MRALIAVALLGVAVGCASCGREASDNEGTLDVRARVVQISGGTLNGLILRGTVALSAEHDAFGGFSGLLMRGGGASPVLTAVTDRGWLLTATLVDTPGGQRLDDAEIQRLRRGDGARAGKRGNDAESLAMRDDTRWIAFERIHRITSYDGVEPEKDIRDRSFARLGSNAGLEALASLPNQGLLAIAEETGRRGAPVFVVSPLGDVRTGYLPWDGKHAVTGADIGPDGRLYLVLRDYSPLSGVSIRIRRYALGRDGFPDPNSRTELAAFDGASGIDNMEGIALWKDQAGRTRLTLISDDNFNGIQRTLVMDFEVTATGS